MAILDMDLPWYFIKILPGSFIFHFCSSPSICVLGISTNRQWAAPKDMASLAGLAGAGYGADEVAEGDGGSRRPCPRGWKQALAAGGVR